MAIKNSSSSSTGFGDASARAEVSDHSVYRVLEDGHSIYDHEIWKSKHTLFNIVYIYIPALVELNYFYYIYICNDIPCCEIIISDNELSKGPLFSEKTNKSQLVWWDFRKEKHSMTVRIF